MEGTGLRNATPLSAEMADVASSTHNVLNTSPMPKEGEEEGKPGSKFNFPESFVESVTDSSAQLTVKATIEDFDMQ